MQISQSKLIVAALLTLASPAASHADANECERLSQMKLPDTSITTAESVSAGDFTSPYGDRIEKLHAFHDAASIDIQTGNDSLGQHREQL